MMLAAAVGEDAIIPVAEKLFVYGPLGLLAGVCLLAAVRMFLLLSKERARFDADLKEQISAHQKEVREQDASHASELKALEERFISKAETWMQKYHEMASSQDATIKGLKNLVDVYRDKG